MWALQPALADHPDLAAYSTVGGPRGPLTYDDCVAITGALKRTEGEVNMLNQYTSARLKEWIKVQRAYEKDGVDLGEGAHRLLQAVQYAM